MAVFVCGGVLGFGGDGGGVVGGVGARGSGGIAGFAFRGDGASIGGSSGGGLGRCSTAPSAGCSGLRPPEDCGALFESERVAVGRVNGVRASGVRPPALLGVMGVRPALVDVVIGSLGLSGVRGERREDSAP